MTKSIRIEDTLRRTYPKSGRGADYGSSPTHAIKLKCLACCGGEGRKVVAECAIYSCPLWRFRPYKDEQVRPDGCVPTREEYEVLIAARSRPAPEGALAGLAAYRARMAAEGAVDEEEDSEEEGGADEPVSALSTRLKVV